MSDGRQQRDESTGDDPLIGEVIDDRFRIESLLGAGSMGRVYRATQISVERDVAIKVLQGSFQADLDYRKRFFREAKAISGFTHPNIVRLIDFGEPESGDAYYIVMELIEGVELSALTERGPLALPFATEIIYQTAAALIEAHEADIIHRDLKTDNLLLMPLSNGTLQVKVLDFGVAFPLESGGARLTQAGFVLGTPPYMAPEQAEGAPGTPVSDVYALGVIYFYMLTGEFPVVGDSKLSTLKKHLQPGRPAPSERIEGSFPPVIDEFITEMIAREPEARPHDGRAVRRRIEEIRKELGWDRVEIQPERSLEEVFLPFVESGESGGGGDVQTSPAKPLVTVAKRAEGSGQTTNVEPGSYEPAEHAPSTGEASAPSTPAPHEQAGETVVESREREESGERVEVPSSQEPSGPAGPVEEGGTAPDPARAELQAQEGRSATHPMRASEESGSDRGTVATMIDTIGWKSAIEEGESGEHDGSFERLILTLLSMLFIAVGVLAAAIFYYKRASTGGGDQAIPILEEGADGAEGSSSVAAGGAPNDVGTGGAPEESTGDPATTEDASTDAAGDGAPEPEPDGVEEPERVASSETESTGEDPESAEEEEEGGGRASDEDDREATGSSSTVQEAASGGASETGGDDAPTREESDQGEQASDEGASASSEKRGSAESVGAGDERGSSESSTGSAASASGASKPDAGSAGTSSGPDAGPNLEKSMEWLEGS